jgi:hypothetical protein
MRNVFLATILVVSTTAIGPEFARKSAGPAMYQGPWLRARITAKLQCLLQSRPGTR